MTDHNECKRHELLVYDTAKSISKRQRHKPMKSILGIRSTRRIPSTRGAASGCSFLPILLALFLGTPTWQRQVSAASYSVGPSQTFATIGAALEAADPLQPGDEIVVYAQSTPYYEKFVLNTAANNNNNNNADIVLRGVPDAEGNLPIIDGSNAVTPLYQDYWNEVRGLIKIGAASIPSGVPSYIRIENFQLRNAKPGFYFTDDGGNEGTEYVENAACVYVEEGSHIRIVNNVITNCGNGIFVTPGVQDVLIEGNYIYGNGNVGSYYEHNVYTEALGIVYRYNRFGPLCSGCLGNNLKDRSGGLVVSYNLIVAGNRQLDLVDSGHDTILADARYRTTYVYGNILFESDDEGNRQIVHYGGDSGDESRYRQGTLHFYHNTIVSLRNGRNTFLRLSSEGETCDARNNIFYETNSESQLELLSENRGTLFLRSTWLKDGYVYSFDTSSGSGTVTVQNTILGNAPPFADSDFITTFDVRLSAPLLPSTSLAPGVPAVDQEYVLHTQSRSRNGSDLGSYGSDSQSSVPPPSSPPAPSPPSLFPPAPVPTPVPGPASAPPPAPECQSCTFFFILPGNVVSLYNNSQGCVDQICIPWFLVFLWRLFGWTCETNGCADLL